VTPLLRIPDRGTTPPNDDYQKEHVYHVISMLSLALLSASIRSGPSGIFCAAVRAASASSQPSISRSGSFGCLTRFSQDIETLEGENGQRLTIAAYKKAAERALRPPGKSDLNEIPLPPGPQRVAKSATPAY
jgi:hypothetical protein